MSTFSQLESNGTAGSNYINARTRWGIKVTGDSYDLIKGTSGSATIQFYLKGDSSYDVDLQANYYDESGNIVSGAGSTTVSLTTDFAWCTFNLSGTVPGTTHCYVMLTDPSEESDIIAGTYWTGSPPPPTNYDNPMCGSDSASGVPVMQSADFLQIKFTKGTASVSTTKDPPPPFNLVSF